MREAAVAEAKAGRSNGSSVSSLSQPNLGSGPVVRMRLTVVSGVVTGTMGVVVGTSSIRVQLSVISTRAAGATAMAQGGTSFPASALPKLPPLPHQSSRAQVPASQQHKLHKFQVLLTSYESVRDDPELFRSIHWRALVISSDEL